MFAVIVVAMYFTALCCPQYFLLIVLVIVSQGWIVVSMSDRMNKSEEYRASYMEFAR
jgi:hypothetical protein